MGCESDAGPPAGDNGPGLPGKLPQKPPTTLEKWRILAWLWGVKTKAGNMLGHSSGGNRITHATHDFLVVEQVVHRVQVRAEDLVDPVKVVQVGPGEVSAYLATT